LFDDRGRQIARDATAGEDSQIEPAHSVFYVANRYSNVAARRLSDGGPQYRFRVEGTDDYSRTFLHRAGARMLVASSKRTMNPMNPAPVKVSALELYEFTEPEAMDEDQLTSVHQRAIRHYEATRLWVAVHGPFVIVAHTNAIEFLDAGCKPQRTFTGAFEPQGMSLDETGRIHLLVQAGGRQALWLISPRGEALAVALDHPVYQRPPVIGYDHTLYLLGAGQVLAIAEDGRIAWNYPSKGRASGAMALPDHRVLVSDGGALAAIDAKGDAKPVHEFPGETLTLPAVLTASGELIAATQNHLYCLAR
jgi:hypothetical protein